jgi:hypothetical protein
MRGPFEWVATYWMPEIEYRDYPANEVEDIVWESTMTESKPAVPAAGGGKGPTPGSRGGTATPARETGDDESHRATESKRHGSGRQSIPLTGLGQRPTKTRACWPAFRRGLLISRPL